MSAEAVVVSLSKARARILTQEVKADAERLWHKLLDLYQGGAHLALGYASWGDYFEKEFGGSKSRGYQILEAARVVDGLPRSTMVERPNERQARELVPLATEPALATEAWAETQRRAEAEARPVTAALVREVVTDFKPGSKNGKTTSKPSPEAAALELIEHFYKGVAAIHYVISIGTKEVWLNADSSDRRDVQQGALDLCGHLRELSVFLKGVDSN